jgi:cell cycle arrest protein BUB2
MPRSVHQPNQDATLRPKIWKVLLGATDISADTYLNYVGRGPCEVREKIRNDTFRCVEEDIRHADDCSCSLRTLATDRGFKSRVREDMLVRLLDAFVWRSQGALSPPFIYLPLM